MPQAEYQRQLLGRANAQHPWEHQIAEGYSVSDLDLPEIERTLRAAVDQGRLEIAPSSPEEALDRLNLRVDGRLVRAAVVLFGRKLLPAFPQCGVRLARFRGTTKTEFLDQRQLHGHSFQLLEEASAFLTRHIPVSGRIKPGKLQREDIPLYPPLALREALVNALCHRDYTLPGGAVSVAIFDDLLEITSSGLLPTRITVADLKRRHASHPRNPLIAEAFFRRGLIERWGRGTQKMVELCVAAAKPQPEYEEQAGDFVVRFRPSHDVSERQQRILQILADGKERRLQEIHAGLEDPPAKRTLLDDLKPLRQLGLIDVRGHGAGAKWRLVTE